jgi:hypothetical protein
MDILMKLNFPQLYALQLALTQAKGTCHLAGKTSRKADPAIGVSGETVNPLTENPFISLANSVRVRVTEDGEDGRSQLVFVHAQFELTKKAARTAQWNTFGRDSYVTVTDGVKTYRVTPTNCYVKNDE